MKEVEINDIRVMPTMSCGTCRRCGRRFEQTVATAQNCPSCGCPIQQPLNAITRPASVPLKR